MKSSTIFGLFLLATVAVSMGLCPKGQFWSSRTRSCLNCSDCKLAQCSKCLFKKGNEFVKKIIHKKENLELGSKNCALDVNCLNCTTVSICGICADGFAINSSGLCGICGTSCLTCSAPHDNSKCLSCPTGHYLSNLSACVLCSSSYGIDCLQCTKDNCTACTSGLTPVAGNPGCTSTPTPTPTPTCPSHCATCSSPTECTVCETGYDVQAGNCTASKVLGAVSPFPIRAMCIALVVLSVGIFFFAIPSIKLAGLEYLFVMQFAWINLAFLPNPYPAAYAEASPLKYTSGYGIRTEQVFHQIGLNLQPQHYMIDTRHLSNNFNLCLLLYLVPLLLVLTFKVMSKTEKYKENSVERMNYWIEILMYGTMANFIGITIFSYIFFAGLEPSHGSSIFIFCLSLLVTVGTLTLFHFNPEPFQRFRYSFKKETLPFNHYYLHTANLFLVTILVAAAPSAPWSPCIPLVVLAVYTLICRPYRVLSENFRSVFYLLVMAIIAIIRTVFYLNSDQWKMSEVPIIILFVLVFVLLLLCAIWAYFEVLRNLLCEKRQEKQLKQLNEVLYEDTKQLNQAFRIYNMTQMRTLNPGRNQNFNENQLKNELKENVGSQIAGPNRNLDQQSQVNNNQVDGKMLKSHIIKQLKSNCFNSDKKNEEERVQPNFPKPKPLLLRQLYFQPEDDSLQMQFKNFRESKLYTPSRNTQVMQKQGPKAPKDTFENQS